MYGIALKMLFGDRGKYLGIIIGIALASLIMIQQPGILISILSHTYSFISDISLPDIWVMDPKGAPGSGSRTIVGGIHCQGPRYYPNINSAGTPPSSASSSAGFGAETFMIHR